DEITGKRPGHHDVAVREVDQPQHAVDHRVAQRDLRVDAADCQPEHDEVEPLRRGISVGDQCGDRSDHDHCHDTDTQAPQDDVHRIETGHGCTPWPDRSAGPRHYYGQIFFGFLPIPNVFGSSEVNSNTEGLNC